MNRRLRLLLKWIKMICGKSDLHTLQGPGNLYSKNKVEGYYSDLTAKVKSTSIFDSNGIPMNIRADGIKVYFPIAIAQYGLGAYDLYLLNQKTENYNRFLKCCDWFVKEQDYNGGWDTFKRIGADCSNGYSAMAQGEAASLLIRAFLETNQNKYLYGAISAIQLMLRPIENGGTSRYIDNELYLEEFVEKETYCVLNGWVFAIFGIIDLLKVHYDKNIVTLLQRTLETLARSLNRYDRSFWSNYDLRGNIASPFYHHLHISLLHVLNDLYPLKNFEIYEKKWYRYYSKKSYNWLAFFLKGIQKIKNPGKTILVK
jgi:heparosan-N-sulfate-glucuronate 5-epimerase